MGFVSEMVRQEADTFLNEGQGTGYPDAAPDVLRKVDGSFITQADGSLILLSENL